MEPTNDDDMMRLIMSTMAGNPNLATPPAESSEIPEVKPVSASEVRQEAGQEAATPPAKADIVVNGLDPATGPVPVMPWEEEASATPSAPPAAEETPAKGKSKSKASNKDNLAPLAGTDPEALKQLGETLLAGFQAAVDGARNQVLDELPEAIRAAGELAAKTALEQIRYQELMQVVSANLNSLYVAVNELAAEVKKTPAVASEKQEPPMDPMLIRKITSSLPPAGKAYPLEGYVKAFSDAAKLSPETVSRVIHAIGAVKDGTVCAAHWSGV